MLFDADWENNEFGENPWESCGDEVNWIPGKRYNSRPGATFYYCHQRNVDECWFKFRFKVNVKFLGEEIGRGRLKFFTKLQWVVENWHNLSELKWYVFFRSLLFFSVSLPAFKISSASCNPFWLFKKSYHILSYRVSIFSDEITTTKRKTIRLRTIWKFEQTARANTLVAVATGKGRLNRRPILTTFVVCCNRWKQLWGWCIWSNRIHSG